MLGSVAELWASADRFGLVVLATPVATHKELAISAFEAGLNVVVEKPMATSVTEGKLILDAARSAGRMLTVFQNRRWDPGPLTARALIQTGQLGRVLRADYRFEMWAPGLGAQTPATDYNGLLFDVGSHNVDGAMELFGEVTSVYAEVARHQGGAIDDVFVAMTHASGVRCHQVMTAYGGLPGPSLLVSGDLGTYAKPPGGRGQPDPFVPAPPGIGELPESPDEMGELKVDGQEFGESLRFLVAGRPSIAGWLRRWLGIAAAGRRHGRDTHAQRT